MIMRLTLGPDDSGNTVWAPTRQIWFSYTQCGSHVDTFRQTLEPKLLRTADDIRRNLTYCEKGVFYF